MIPILLFTCLGLAAPDGVSIDVDTDPYGLGPDHLWSRIHRLLFVREDQHGARHGVDELDPLLWPNSTYLLEQKVWQDAISRLEEVIGTATPKTEREAPAGEPGPLSHALFQRDLLAIHAWLAAPRLGPTESPTDTEKRQALAKRLAAVVRRIALDREQIEQLPDNYRQAVASDDAVAEVLPGDLTRSSGSWVQVTGLEGRPAVPGHLEFFGFRSHFTVHLRLPGGRKPTETYLRTLREVAEPLVSTADGPALRDDLPQFPPRTEVALVRRMILIDEDGRPQPTSLVESVQIRRYRRIDLADPQSGASGLQEMVDVELNRRALSRGRHGGLVLLGPGRRRFPRFGSHGFDPLVHAGAGPFDPLTTCIQCHGQPGIYSVTSLTGIMAPGGFPQRRTLRTTFAFAVADSARQLALTLEGLENTPSFAALRRAWTD